MASKTIADYSDAVRRITNANVDPASTTRAEVRRDLETGDVGPQVTRDVIDGIVENVLTEDRVLEAIEATGELPNAAELDAMVSVSDDYNQSDRQATVEREIRQSVATREDVQQAVHERQASKGDRPTFREEVETAVDEVASRKQFVGESPDQVAGEQAREIGAPRENDFRRATAQTIAKAEQVTPADVVDGTRAKTPVSVIRDAQGDVVAATGGPSDEIGRQVAEQYGADYMDTSDVESSMNVEGTGDRVSLTLRGQKLGEIDVR